MCSYEIKEYRTAKRFLDYLQIRQGHWLPKGEWTSPWVFRGHGNADWELKPRIWRKPEDDPIPEKVLKRFQIKQDNDDLEELFRSSFNELTYRSRLGFPADWGFYVNWIRVPQEKLPNLLKALQFTFAEVDAIRDFIALADRIGYLVPRQWEFGSWREVMVRHIDQVCNPRHAERLSLETYFFVWDGRNHPATALAQHHGVPTSLLDWTQKPMVAALFAAEDVLYKVKDAKRLAVWALNTHILDDGQMHEGEKRRLQKLTVPRSELAYLHAQDSLFTYDSGADKHFILNDEWPSIEDVISSESPNDEKMLLRKVTLPTSEVRELLRLLWAEGITRASIMPGYDNVTKALETRWHWQ